MGVAQGGEALALPLGSSARLYRADDTNINFAFPSHSRNCIFTLALLVWPEQL